MREQRWLPRTRNVVRIDEIARVAEGARVLNIGLGGWLEDEEMQSLELANETLEETLHMRLAKTAKELVGTDINAPSIEQMRKHLPGEYVLADLTDSAFAQQFDGKFDLIVFGEVLEHLDDFRTALQNLKSLLTPNGRLLITTPNAYSVERIAKILFRYEACHEEHTAYFSYLTMRRLLQMNGLEMERFDFQTERPPHNQPFSRKFAFGAQRAIAKLFPQLSDGLFILARPVGTGPTASS